MIRVAHFVTLLGALTALPNSAQAQQRPVQGAKPPVEGYFTEPAKLEKGLAILEKRMGDGPAEPKDGLSISTGDMITGAGFLAVGPQYQRRVLNRRAVFTASAALSTRLYSSVLLNLEAPSRTNDFARGGVQVLFQDSLRVNYFGRGNETTEGTRSGYRLTTTDISGYGVIGAPRLSVTARIGSLQGPAISKTAGFRPDYPDTVTLFDTAEAAGLTDGIGFLHGDVTLSRDTRDNPGHPRRGGHYQTTWAVFADRDSRHSFQRYELDAARFLPLGSERWTLALRGWIVGSRAVDSQSVPFYLMPNLGGRTLRSYRDYRFSDLAMHVYSVESRWALFRHIDVAGFVDLGSVAPSVSRLTFGDLKSSYGAGLRLHTGQSTVARIDFAHGDEGWRFVFKMNDPFRRASQSAGRPPVVPFVP